MTRKAKRSRPARPGQSTAAPTAPRTSLAGRSAAPRSGPAAAPPSQPRELGVALSLLKYFYWIEIGIRSYLRSRNNIEFSRAEGLIIASILLGYSRPSDIARQLGVRRQGIHVTIQQMKKKGIVDLVPDPKDGRINQVVLTGFAKKMNDDGIIGMNLLWEELGRRLGRANLDKAAKVLRADWGPPVTFDAAEEGLNMWHQDSR
jgi:DNA-binding MarR family transcriptional regulator